MKFNIDICISITYGASHTIDPHNDLKAQLVEHSNGIAEVRVRVPIRSEFFSLSRYFLSSAQNCEDHALKICLLQCAPIFFISFPFHNITISNVQTIRVGQIELPSDLDVTIIFHQCPATFQAFTCGFFSCVLVPRSLRHPQSQKEVSSMRKTSLTKSSRVVLVT